MASTTPQSQASPSVPLNKLSHHAQWAALSIRSALADFQDLAGVVPTKDASRYRLLPIGNIRIQESYKDSHGTGFKVGIIGAGAAGMFTALIFDYLNETYNLNVAYEILEADENRCGGRLFTYTFPKRKDQPRPEKHDYYDVGAMRFPYVDGGVMDRTFQLFVKTLKMNFVPDPENNPPEPGDLIPYVMSGPNNPYLYNSIQVVHQPEPKPFGLPVLSAATFHVPNLPPNVETVAASALVDDQIEEYKKIYDKDGPKAFWDKLKKEVDPYSVRQFLTNKAGFDYNTIEFLETMNFGNRWYDQAASEMVLEYLDFDSNAKWWCVEGGTKEIASRMQAAIKEENAIKFGKVVTAISYNNSNPRNAKVDVTVDGEAHVRTYDAVFNSAPLGAMQHMQLEGLNLEWGMKSAIRSLGYGASCKVGMRFNTMWWKDPLNGLNITHGGQAKTDLPIRCCVYPSYNMYDPYAKPGVLLVSYTWSQEAERIGSLINRESPDKEEELKKVLFHDLARLHAKSGDDADYKRLYKIISDNYLDHFAYNWYQNPRAVGGFAYFGPQQFSNYYNNLTASAGKYMVIGEAASAHHAWVVGALESAVRGVYQFVCKLNDPAAQAVTKAYEKGNIPAPFGPLPYEFDWTNDIKLPEVRLPEVKLPKDAAPADVTMPSPVGLLARMQVLLEGIRLDQGGDMLDPSKITKDEIKPILDLIS